MYNSNSLPFILFISHYGTHSNISGTITVTVPECPQRPDNCNVIPTTSQCHSHLTETVLGKYIPNTSALPNDHVYNDIIIRLNSYPIFHSYRKKFIFSYFICTNISFFTYFSLGPKVAHIYRMCEVNTSRRKTSTQIEMNMVNKKSRGRNIAEDIMDQCCHLSKFIGTVTSIRKICHLR